MKHLIRALLGATFCLLPVLLSLCSGCNGDNDGQTKKKVRLAYIPYSADLPFFVAMEKGMFQKRALEIEPIKCASSSEALDLVLAGRADGAMGNSFSIIYSIHAKDPTKLRLVNVSGETLEQDRFTGFILVRADSSIVRPEQLKGKRIGTGKGASQLLWVQLYFKEMNLDPKKDVFIEQEATDVLLNALHSGQMDALFVFEPYATVAIQKGFAKPLVPFFRRSVINPFPAGGATLSRSFCQEYPELSRKVIEALDQAVDLINTKPEGAKLSLVSYTPLNREESIASQIYYWWGSKEMPVPAMQKLADILTDNEMLDERIDVSTMCK